MKNFQIVNLAHEDKLIYIDSTLYSLKGMVITPVSYYRSTRYSAHEKGNTIPLANTAFHFALENAARHPGRTSICLLNEAARMGVTFTDEGYCRTVELKVSKGAFEGCYSVGNIYDIDNELEATARHIVILWHMSNSVWTVKTPQTRVNVPS